MVLEYLFLGSGLCIALLLVTKVREMRLRRQPVLLRLISRGDERLADLSHRFAHLYADSKRDIQFFVEKQLPLYARRISNKVEAGALKVTERVTELLRDSKYFKKSGSLSDYFKSFAEEDKTEDSAASDTKENRVE